MKLLLQITRMESLHTKQQNVLRRKMEEAVASNKRLRDVMEKQRAAKKTSRDGDVKNGLAGAAERMRNFVTQVTFFVIIQVNRLRCVAQRGLEYRTRLEFKC